MTTAQAGQVTEIPISAPEVSREAWSAVLPPAALALLALWLGLWVPGTLRTALTAASHLLGGL